MGDRLHPRSAGGLRLSQSAAEPRSYSRDSRQCHGGREALSHCIASCTFRNTLTNWPRAPASPRLPETYGATLLGNCTTAWPAASRTITEDTMPGELANCIAGRIANIFNFHGPNYVVDAACASAMAAISAAVEGLVANDFDRRGYRRHRPQHGRLELSSSSARSVRSRRLALVPMLRAPMASSWARARRFFC